MLGAGLASLPPAPLRLLFFPSIRFPVTITSPSKLLRHSCTNFLRYPPPFLILARNLVRPLLFLLLLLSLRPYTPVLGGAIRALLGGS